MDIEANTDLVPVSTPQRESVCPFWDNAAESLVNLGRKGVAQGRTWRKQYAQNRLAKELGGIIEKANAHQAKGMAPGAPLFVELYALAHSRIDLFCQTWNVDRSLIEAEVPALQDLQVLTIPVAQASLGSRIAIGAVFALLALLLLSVVFGVSAGLTHSSHNLVFHAIMHVFHQ